MQDRFDGWREKVTAWIGSLDTWRDRHKYMLAAILAVVTFPAIAYLGVQAFTGAPQEGAVEPCLRAASDRTGHPMDEFSQITWAGDRGADVVVVGLAPDGSRFQCVASPGVAADWDVSLEPAD